MKPKWWQHPQFIKVAIGTLWHHYHGKQIESPEANAWLLDGGWIAKAPHGQYLTTYRGKRYIESVYKDLIPCKLTRLKKGLNNGSSLDSV